MNFITQCVASSKQNGGLAAVPPPEEPEVNLKFRFTANCTSTSTSNPTLMTPLTWKNARFTRVRSSGRTRRCS